MIMPYIPVFENHIVIIVFLGESSGGGSFGSEPPPLLFKSNIAKKVQKHHKMGSKWDLQSLHPSPF